LTPLGDLRAQVFENDPTTKDFAPIGSLDEKGKAEALVEFSTLGAGIKSVRLADHFDTIKKDVHTAVQTEHVHTPPMGTDGVQAGSEIVVPMAADSVEIDGKVVSLLGYFDDPVKGVVGSAVWRQVAPGSFEAFVVDGAGKRVARVERTYSLTPGSYVIRVAQKVENLSGQEIKIRWFQFGPVDLEQDSASYGGDKRRARFGYLLNAQAQASDPTVSSKDFLWSRSDAHVMGALVRQEGSTVPTYPTVKTVWPNDVSNKYGYRPVWAGMTNRYFGAAILPLVAPGATADQKEMKLAATVDRILLHRWLMVGGEVKYEPVMIFRTTSVPMTVASGAAADVSVGFYAGPLSRPVIGKDAQAEAVGLLGLVVYNFGGACGFCTFPFLTGALLWLLRFLHGYIVFDWALAIIVLVLVVRTILHPVTKWSQIRMQRFGKQMQAMAPKQKKIQEKYGSDPQKLREEMGRLWREEGVSPTGMLGCIPMFLQTPVWIALYATLYFAIELRHEGAFFGVFQKVSGGKWWFLGDLAEPDRFIYFGKTLVTLPILGPITSINILPAILGVVFFIQQKYLTPPTTGTMTPEQEQQQKIMKWMMVFMFPVMMYSSPSGLALYFIANSTLGILESRYIRSHIDKYDLMAAKKPAGGQPGFLARLQQIAEERQRQMTGRGGQPPRKRV
jgi:YidC/Oxa1 family membrane protein insertase